MQQDREGELEPLDGESWLLLCGHSSSGVRVCGDEGLTMKDIVKVNYSERLLEGYCGMGDLREVPPHSGHKFTISC